MAAIGRTNDSTGKQFGYNCRQRAAIVHGNGGQVALTQFGQGPRQLPACGTFPDLAVRQRVGGRLHGVERSDQPALCTIVQR